MTPLDAKSRILFPGGGQAVQCKVWMAMLWRTSWALEALRHTSLRVYPISPTVSRILLQHASPPYSNLLPYLSQPTINCAHIFTLPILCCRVLFIQCYNCSCFIDSSTSNKKHPSRTAEIPRTTSRSLQPSLGRSAGLSPGAQ